MPRDDYLEVDLAYGRDGLKVRLPRGRTTLIEPTYVPGLPDQVGALQTALRNPLGAKPLRQLVQPGQTVAISVCDGTRPMPSKVVLPVLLAELGHIPSEDITILVATGTHRPNTDSELQEILGEGIFQDFRVVNHSAFDSNGLKRLEDTPAGIPVYLNRIWVDSDVRITTGFVEPHFFAGFSGGPKMVAPGLAGFDTIMRLHNADMIGHAKATWGVTHGNPIHDAVRDIARQTGVDFSLDVTINRDRDITSAYAGEMFQVHQAACRVAKGSAMQAVDASFDVVLTTNSGFPLDQNLYQAVKGMSAAAQVVKQGGSILCAAECSDGIPAHGRYQEILASASGPEELLAMINTPGYDRHDQWQVQIQAQIQIKARVLLKSSFLSQGEVRAAHLEYVDDLDAAVEEELARHGSDARICVLPEGPQTIPYVS
ncbi:MAG: nickel-dependent lactate racemase [Chloroflexi bacterium]|nr:nickel-dependent lactate racemase [Chloroflexota bacterium]MCI0821902.1 nickel-dependent lactate racemase [Chloroflexota bacterium]MCI0840170.1 nickel-dependent lactate racemase [Chloroflexota bacterium]